MANHLEQLISEWLELKGYFVRRNIKVGKLSSGGYAGELDIVAYHPDKEHLLHVEPSIDGLSWEKRETHFLKKFKAGQDYIDAEIFPWVRQSPKLDQWAVLWGSEKNHSTIGGGTVVPIWKLYNWISEDILALGEPESRAIPEAFLLLRTMQYTMHWVKPENKGK